MILTFILFFQLVMNEIVYAVVILFAVDCLGQKVYFYKCQGHKPCQDGLTVELNFTSQVHYKSGALLIRYTISHLHFLSDAQLVRCCSYM